MKGVRFWNSNRILLTPLRKAGSGNEFRIQGEDVSEKRDLGVKKDKEGND